MIEEIMIVESGIVAVAGTGTEAGKTMMTGAGTGMTTTTGTSEYC